MSQRYEQRYAERHEDGAAPEDVRWPGKRTKVAAALGDTPEATSHESDPRRPDIARIRSAIGSLSGGAPLPDQMRTDFSAQLGIDLGGVRVHADHPGAAELGAQGFTHGEHIALAPGLDPASDAGEHVIAHELVHVAQNLSAGGDAMQFAARLDVGPSDSPVEREAEAGARALGRGESFRVSSRSNLPGISLFEGPTPAPSGTKEPTPPPSPTPRPTSTPSPSPKPSPAPTGTPTTKPGAQPTGTPIPTRPRGPAVGPVPAPTASRAAPSATPNLDAMVKAEMEKRADPALKAKYGQSTAQIDILRIQANQYSFQPTGVGNVILSSLWPWEQLKQHRREISLTNPYDSGSLQAWIEGTRGVIRILGDITGWVSTIADIVAAVSGLLALISSWTGAGLAIFGAIAAISAEVGTIAGLVNIALNLIDALISVVQMILLVQKIKASKDPNERAKLAALLGREVKEFSSTTTGILVQVGTTIVTAGVAAGVSSAFAKSLKSFPKNFLKEMSSELSIGSVKKIRDAASLPLRTPRAALRETTDVASITRKEITDGAVTLQRIETRRVKVKSKLSRAKRKGKPTQWREVVTKTEKKILRPEDLPKRLPKSDKNIKREVRFVIDPNKLKRGIPVEELEGFVKDSSAVPVGAGGNNVQANAKKGDAPQHPPDTSAAPKAEDKVGSSPLTSVAMWPSQLEQFKAAKTGLAPANDRLMTQYNLAKDQAGVYKSGQLEKVFGGVKNNAGQMRLQALQKQTDAQEGALQSEKGAQTAADGKQKKSQLDGKQSQMDGSVQKMGAQKVEKPAPREGGSWFDKAKDWLYNNTIGRIGDAVSGLTGIIQNAVGGWVMAKAGLTKEELDMAGIENGMRADHQKDKQTEAQMKEAEAESKKVDPALAELMKDASKDEQLALQAMVESQEFMTAIDEASAALDKAITEGTAYITEVTPIIRHELETKQGGKAIDAAYVAPVIGGANAFKTSIAGGTDELANPPAQDAAGELAAAKQAWPELDISSGLAQITNAKSRFMTGHAGVIGDGNTAADQAIGKLNSLVGTTDYDGVIGAAHALEAAMQAFAQNEERCVEVYLRNLDKIIDAHVSLIQSCVTQQEVVFDEEDPIANDQPVPAPSPVPAPAPTPVQRKADGDAKTDDASTVAARGTAGSGGKLPHADIIQASFGHHDISGVEAHVGGGARDAAGELGAKAYASGNKVGFADSPDLFLAAHEAAHVVQQRGGVQLKAGIDTPGDAHEQHADAVAAAVVAGKSAEGLLDNKPGASVDSAPTIQRKAATPDAPAVDAKPDQPGKDKTKDKDPNAPKPDAHPKKGGGTPAISPDAQNAKGKDGKDGKDQPKDAQPKGGKAPTPGAKPDPKAVPPAGGGARKPAEPTGDAIAAKPVKQAAPVGAKPVAPADAVAVPQMAAVQPLHLDAPKPSKKLDDKWIKETGRTPAQHHEQINTALAELTTDVQTKQTELATLADQHATKVTQELAAKLEGFKGSIVTPGRARVVTAFGGMTKSLDDAEKKALADIATSKKTGEAQIKTTRAAKATELKNKFTAAKAGNEQLVAKNAPAAAAQVRTFAAGIKPFVDAAKKKAVDQVAPIAAEYDPAKAGDATGGLESAHKSLVADVYKNHAIAHGKKLGAQYEAKLTGVGKDVDKKAQKIVSDALAPSKAELDLALETVDKAATKNLDDAATQLTTQLDTQEKSSTKAVGDAKLASTKKLETEKAAALELADKAGKDFTDNATAAGSELATRIKKKAADDSKNYAVLVADIQKNLRKGGPHKYEDIAPKIADAKARLAAGHAENLDGLQKLVATGSTELGVTVGKQQETYLTAIKDQEAQAKKVEAEIVKDVGKGAADMTGSLGNLAKGFDETVTKETAKVDGAVGNFNANANAALKDFEKKVGEQLITVREGLDKELETSLQPEMVKADIAKDADKEVASKEKQLEKDHGALRDAMDGWGTSENAIYGVLRKCSYGEIEYLEASYDRHYNNRGKNGLTPLRYDLQDEMEGNELKIALSYLDHDRTTAIKLELADSTGFFNDDEARIEEVLRGCSEEEITFLNTNPEAKAVVAGVKDSLGGCDLDVMNTLLDQQISKEDRATKANAIRLFDAMEGMGTDEAKIKQILESANTPEERARLRAQFNAYAATKPIAYMEGWAGGSGKEGDDMLDRALGEELSDGELTLAKTLAATERDDKDVKVAKIIEGADGAGTNEEQIFDALEDEEYAAKWKALKEKGDVEGLRKLEEDHKKDLDARMKKLGSSEGIQELIDGEMTKSYLTYEEFTSGKRKDGTPVTDADRKFLMDAGSGYLEWMVAQRKLQTGTAEPELQLAYACWGVAGTDEDLIDKVLSNGGEPKTRGEIKAIRDAFHAVWKRNLVDRDELADPENMKFPDPGGVLSEELGGKDWNKTRVLLCGKPETPAQLRYVRKLQAKYATSGLLGGVLMDAGEAIGFTEAKSTMEHTEKEFDTKYEDLRKKFGSQQLTTMQLAEMGQDGEELERLGRYLEMDVEAYNKALNSIVDTVVTVLEIVGGIIVTVVTAGTASPVLAAIIGNLIVSAGTIAFKYAALGDQYGAGDLAKDVTTAAITAGFAGLGEVKALTKLSDNVAKKATGVLFNTVTEGVNKGGGRLIGTTLELGPKGIATVQKVVSAGTKNLILSTGQEIANTLTDEKTYDMKLGEALWGENSLGARLLKNAPKAFAEGAVKQWIDESAGVSNKDNKGGHRTAGANMLANAMSDMGANTVGFFVYVDNYQDAGAFWDQLLKSNAQKGLSGFFQGYGMHKMRAKKTARDFINGDVTAADLEAMDFLDPKEKRELAEFVAKYGDPSKLPDAYRKLLGGATPVAHAAPDAQAPKPAAPPHPPAVDHDDPVELKKPIDDLDAKHHADHDEDPKAKQAREAAEAKRREDEAEAKRRQAEEDAKKQKPDDDPDAKKADAKPKQDGDEPEPKVPSPDAVAGAAKNAVQILGAGEGGNPIKERLAPDTPVFRVQDASLKLEPHASPYFDPEQYSLPQGQYEALYVCSDKKMLEKLRRGQGYFEKGMVMHETTIGELLASAGPGAVIVADAKFNMSVLGAEQGGYIIVRKADGSAVAARPREMTPDEHAARQQRIADADAIKKKTLDKQQVVKQRESADQIRQDARALQKAVRAAGHGELADQISDLLAPARMGGKETRLLNKEHFETAAAELQASGALAKLAAMSEHLPPDLAAQVKKLTATLGETFDVPVPAAPTAKPAVDEKKPVVEEKKDDAQKAKQDGPQAPVTPQAPASPETAPTAPKETAARAIPGTSFHGAARASSDPPAVMRQVSDSLALVAKKLGGKVVGDHAIEVEVSPGKGQPAVPRTIRFEPEAPTAGAASPVAHYDHNAIAGTGEIVVKISDRALDEHVARALAHEVAEIKQRLKVADSGPDRPDALAPGSTATELSPHDRGRLAELDVMAERIRTARKDGDQDTIKRLQSETDALLKHLGLDGNSPEAQKRRALVNKEGNALDRAKELLTKDAFDKLVDKQPAAPPRPVPQEIADLKKVTNDMGRDVLEALVQAESAPHLSIEEKARIKQLRDKAARKEPLTQEELTALRELGKALQDDPLATQRAIDRAKAHLPPGAPDDTAVSAERPALSQDSVILDTNLAGVVDKAEKDLQNDTERKYKQKVAGIADKRASDLTHDGEGEVAHKLDPKTTQVGKIPLVVSRDSPEFAQMVSTMVRYGIGTEHGEADRAIAAEAFFAKTVDGKPAKLMTGDHGMVTGLLRVKGIDPRTYDLDHNPEFEVTVNGRTLRVEYVPGA
ncbi:MAG TPA: DUF4157 domain-containing protein [Kofleriaceae bacterium]|nr:DUF4157 domain-containing protein [Kofleriaceae bacterium]